MPGLALFFTDIAILINAFITPLIFSAAFIVFFWGVFQYFIAGAADEDKRKKGRSFVLYGLIGFILMFALWGILNLILNTFGLGGEQRPPLPLFGGQGGGGNGGGQQPAPNLPGGDPLPGTFDT